MSRQGRGKTRQVAELLRSLRTVHRTVRNYAVRGRRIATIFDELPSREHFPDYYYCIEEPICLQDIHDFIGQNKYVEETSAFARDFCLIFANAKQYNRPRSQIYKDAVVLEKVFRDAIQKHVPSLIAVSNSVTDAESDAEEEEEEAVYQGTMSYRERMAQQERQSSILLTEQKAQELATMRLFGVAHRSAEEIRAEREAQEMLDWPISMRAAPRNCATAGSNSRSSSSSDSSSQAARMELPAPTSRIIEDADDAFNALRTEAFRRRLRRGRLLSPSWIDEQFETIYDCADEDGEPRCAGTAHANMQAQMEASQSSHTADGGRGRLGKNKGWVTFCKFCLRGTHDLQGAAVICVSEVNPKTLPATVLSQREGGAKKARVTKKRSNAQGKAPIVPIEKAPLAPIEKKGILTGTSICCLCGCGQRFSPAAFSFHAANYGRHPLSQIEHLESRKPIGTFFVHNFKREQPLSTMVSDSRRRSWQRHDMQGEEDEEEGQEQEEDGEGNEELEDVPEEVEEEEDKTGDDIVLHDQEDETEDAAEEGATPRTARKGNRILQSKRRRMHSDATISMVYSRSLRKRPRSCVMTNGTDSVREKRRRMCRIN